MGKSRIAIGAAGHQAGNEPSGQRRDPQSPALERSFHSWDIPAVAFCLTVPES